MRETLHEDTEHSQNIKQRQKMSTDQREWIRARLPPYEEPPPWIPPFEREEHQDFNNDIKMFLPRNLILQRNRASDQLGFNIRGGQEHHCGIFVSKVTSRSEADRLGLKEGDQILSVNKADFENIDYAEAVKVLKMNTTIHMTVRYFPYGYDRTYDKSRYLAANQPGGPR